MKFKVLSDVYNQYTVDIRTKAYALQFVFIIKAMVLLGGSIPRKTKREFIKLDQNHNPFLNPLIFLSL